MSLFYIQTCTHLWTLSRTFLGVCTHPYTGARVSSTNERTHVPTPRRFLRKPSAAFYVYLFLLLFLCIFFRTFDLKKCSYVCTSHPKNVRTCFPTGDVRDRKRERYNRVYVLSRVRTGTANQVNSMELAEVCPQNSLVNKNLTNGGDPSMLPNPFSVFCTESSSKKKKKGEINCNRGRKCP